MKIRILFKLIIPLLAVFFLLQMSGDFYHNQAQSREETGEREPLFTRAGKIFPLDSEILFQRGVEMLKQAMADNDPAGFLQARDQFLKVVSRNPFHYRGQFFLAKSYFLLNRMNSDDFKRGIEALKKTAYLKKKNQEVAVNVIEALLSLWPHLEEADREYTIGIFRHISTVLTTRPFQRILAAWDRTCKDLVFFEEGMAHRPDLYHWVADILARNQIHLEKRFVYLKEYEKDQFFKLKNDFESLSNSRQFDSGELFSRLLQLYRSLNSRIRGYHRLDSDPDETFQQQVQELRKELIFALVRLHFEVQRPENHRGLTDSALETALLDYLDIATLEEKGKLLEMLENHSFFNQQDLHSFYLQCLLKFRSNRDEEVMAAIEEFLATVSFVKDPHLRDYHALKILLADVYIKNRFLIRAEDLLLEIDSPESFGLEIASRLGQIYRIIGNNRPGESRDPQVLEALENSRRLRLDSLVVRQRVYPVSGQPLVITIPPSTLRQLEDYHLLQVFIDGQLRYETYPRLLTGEITLPVDDRRKLEILIQPRKIKAF